ncbi:Zinc finger CCCH domain-containing protein 45 [Neolecta irregularis DAH-3]|uniref:Zinc finger CCCH domain-containing protein 45 n=1 Tax=Neolecta irregularis (strain DAH-3) TaxID=1198029 RepID=A0A1U7LRH9_NEOID|nr:Zinc finger CCCH domain-containing protein 45 [Neolecta irregularis DAH-3]|eukprot:OLL25276.1 Zinc finger CCCH domain-containing protein 45 [Neolecta irregularis DAH-3]
MDDDVDYSDFEDLHAENSRSRTFEADKPEKSTRPQSSRHPHGYCREDRRNADGGPSLSDRIAPRGHLGSYSETDHKRSAAYQDTNRGERFSERPRGFVWGDTQRGKSYSMSRGGFSSTGPSLEDRLNLMPSNRGRGRGRYRDISFDYSARNEEPDLASRISPAGGFSKGRGAHMKHPADELSLPGVSIHPSSRFDVYKPNYSGPIQYPVPNAEKMSNAPEDHVKRRPPTHPRSFNPDKPIPTGPRADASRFISFKNHTQPDVVSTSHVSPPDIEHTEQVPGNAHSPPTLEISSVQQTVEVEGTVATKDNAPGTVDEDHPMPLAQDPPVEQAVNNHDEPRDPTPLPQPTPRVYDREVQTGLDCLVKSEVSSPILNVERTPFEESPFFFTFHDQDNSSEKACLENRSRPSLKWPAFHDIPVDTEMDSIPQPLPTQNKGEDHQVASLNAVENIPSNPTPIDATRLSKSADESRELTLQPASPLQIIEHKQEEDKCEELPVVSPPQNALAWPPNPMNSRSNASPRPSAASSIPDLENSRPAYDHYAPNSQTIRTSQSPHFEDGRKRKPIRDSGNRPRANFFEDRRRPAEFSYQGRAHGSPPRQFGPPTKVMGHYDNDKVYNRERVMDYEPLIPRDRYDVQLPMHKSFRSTSRELESRYFVVQSPNDATLSLGFKQSVWATAESTALRLSKAMEVSRVVLIFTIQKSDIFYGYAEMLCLPGKAESPGYYRDVDWLKTGSFGLRWIVANAQVPTTELQRFRANQSFLDIRDGADIELEYNIGIEVCRSIYAKSDRAARRR